MAMSSGKVNDSELIAALINRCSTLVDGIKYAQELIEGSCTIMLLTEDGIIVARDKVGRLPIVIGQNENGCCAAMDSFAWVVPLVSRLWLKTEENSPLSVSFAPYPKAFLLFASL